MNDFDNILQNWAVGIRYTIRKIFCQTIKLQESLEILNFLENDVPKEFRS